MTKRETNAYLDRLYGKRPCLFCRFLKWLDYQFGM